MTEFTPLVIKYADLDLAAVRAGHARSLELWYATSHLRTWVSPRAALSTDPMPRAMMRKILRAGDGLFWRRYKGGFYRRSVARVARALGVATIRAAYNAPAFPAQRLAVLRARLTLEAWGAIREGRPISNLTMAKVSGVHRRTIQRQKRLAGIGAMENFALLAQERQIVLCPQSTRRIVYGGEHRRVRQLPSSLPVPETSHTRRCVRRVNGRLRSILASGHSPASPRGGPARVRRYVDWCVRAATSGRSPGALRRIGDVPGHGMVWERFGEGRS